MFGITGIHHHRAASHQVTAHCRPQFHHAWGKGAHCGNEGILTRAGIQYHATGRRGGDDQRAVRQGRRRVVHHPGLSTQRTDMRRKRLGARRAA
ncbi:hypothetical protein SDC9_212111 [bioreactor metagenome]|uniref:Uncharacterized protein n=1 Tax=bioreactor metagenome TaxID=1076179 RepID=A0A645JNK2_9ZZZZ